MNYEIIRLVALDWSATVDALRTRGVDFNWGECDGGEAEVQEEGAPLVHRYDGPIASCPGWRDPEANWIYEVIRKRLDAESCAACDECFSKLFWDNGEGGRLYDLRDTGCSLEGVWCALEPASVVGVLAQVRGTPFHALETAASAVRWESRIGPMNVVQQTRASRTFQE